eukprot:12406680-Karenia_brevis.AAC.1
MPFIVGADWNMDPNILASSTFHELLHAHIIADMSPVGTFEYSGGVTTIDYFVCSLDMAEAFVSVEIQADAPIAGHRPMAAVLRSDVAELTRLS